MRKILVATVKPFAAAAVNEIRSITDKAGYELLLLEKYEDNQELLNAVSEVDALIVRSDKVTREVLDAAKKLKIVVRAGAGYDNLDLEAASAHDVVAMNTPGQNSNAVAELALGMMIFMARNQFNGKPGTELKGKTLGIHAFGHVGSLVGHLAKSFGMQVFAFDPFLSSNDIEKEGVIAVGKVEELYRNSMYISLHIPATEKTRESVDFDLLNLMPSGATLINTARKEVIHEPSLLKMFAAREDFRYAADIAPGIADELSSTYAERYFSTPKKMGAQTAEANINAGIAAVNQIIDFFGKGITRFKVN